MGLLIDGVWHEQDPDAEDPRAAGGRFERAETAFRNWVTPDGRPGPTGHDGFAASAGRYHLYVSLACPLGAPHPDHARAEGTGANRAGLGDALADGGAGVDVRAGRGGDPRSAVQQPLSARIVYARRSANYSGRPACRCCGTSTRRPSSTTNPPRSSACSTRRSTRWARRPAIIYPKDRRAEIDAIDARVLRHAERRRVQGGFRHHAGRHTKRRWCRCSTPWTGWKTGSASRASCSATA